MRSAAQQKHFGKPMVSTIAYNSIPAGPLSSNIASVGFQGGHASEFGDGVNLAASGTLGSVSFVVDEWGCQNRAAPPSPNPYGLAGTCTTTPGATFPLPITLNVYKATNTGTEVGASIATVNQTFNIPYRPSDTPNTCGPATTLGYTNAFLDPVSGQCVYGQASEITFNLTGQNAATPSIYTIAFDTSNYGYSGASPPSGGLPGPYGDSNPCNSTYAGCPYDSLNISADSSGGISAGSYYDVNGIFWNTAVAGFYCDGGALGVGILRIDSSPGACSWAPNHPEIQVTLGSTVCNLITDSTGHSFTVAHLGGGKHIDVEYASHPCDVGIYVSPAYGGDLDYAVVNGGFGIGIYVDNLGDRIMHQDNTSICVNRNNLESCKSGIGSSNGTGEWLRNTPNFWFDHTFIDSYVAGIATLPCPNSANNITGDNTKITKSTYPWSFQGGKINVSHSLPPLPSGGSCAGSSVGDGGRGGV